jgi:hydroxyacylglutathione hydrolase
MREQQIPTIPSTIGQEKQVNPFLRTQEPDVIKAAALEQGANPNDPIEVLGALREMKNKF